MGILNSKQSASTPLYDPEFWAKHSGNLGVANVHHGDGDGDDPSTTQQQNSSNNGKSKSKNRKKKGSDTIAGSSSSSNKWSNEALELLANVFPEDLWILVFEFLDKKSQSSVKLTCKSFDRMANLANNSFLFNRDPSITVKQVMQYLKIDTSGMMMTTLGHNNDKVDNDDDNENVVADNNDDENGDERMVVAPTPQTGYGHRLLILDLSRLLIDDDELLYMLKCCPLVHTLQLSRCTKLSPTIFYKLSIHVDSIKTLRLPESKSYQKNYSFVEWIETQHRHKTSSVDQPSDNGETGSNSSGGSNLPKIRMHLNNLSIAMFHGALDDTFIQYVRMEPSLQSITINFEGMPVTSFAVPGFVSSSIRDITCINYLSHQPLEDSLVTMFPNLHQLSIVSDNDPYNFHSNSPISSQLFQSLEQLEHMSEMEFFGGRVRPEPLMQALKTMNHLTKLTSVSQQLSDPGEFDFESMEHLLPTIRTIALGNYLYRNVHKLQMARSLTSLTLDSSGSGVFNGEELGAALVALAPHLIHLLLGACTVHNHPPFVDAFSRFQRLEMIDLRSCRLGSEVIDGLVQNIADNANLALSLKELHLCSSEVSSTEHLVLLVRRFLSIRCINISHSKIEDDSVLRELCDRKRVLLINIQSGHGAWIVVRSSRKLYL